MGLGLQREIEQQGRDNSARVEYFKTYAYGLRKACKEIAQVDPKPIRIFVHLEQISSQDYKHIATCTYALQRDLKEYVRGMPKIESQKGDFVIKGDLTNRFADFPQRIQTTANNLLAYCEQAKKKIQKKKYYDSYLVLDRGRAIMDELASGSESLEQCLEIYDQLYVLGELSEGVRQPTVEEE